MSPINGRANMNCRPAGFSDDDSDGDGDGWRTIKRTKVQMKYCINPQVQFENSIKDGNLEEVKAALTNGATVQGTDSAGYTGLMAACSYGHSQVVQYLVNQRSQTNVCTSSLIYPLMVVCFSRCEDESRLLECAQILIKEYVNVNAVDVHGTTALMFACKSGYCTLVDELIKSGANIHMLDTQNWNALHHAANAGNAGVVGILLAAGARKSVKDAQGRKPFQIAMIKPGCRDLAEALCPKRFRHMLEPEIQEYDIFHFQLEETAFQYFFRKVNSIAENLNRRRPTEKGQQLNLYEFLTTTDEELQALGMERSWHRRQTLEFIKGYLLQPWERLVQPRLTKFGEAIAKWNADKGIAYKSMYPRLTYISSAHLMIGVAKRLQIVQASTDYMKMNLDLEVVDERIQQQIQLTALSLRLLEKEMEKLMKSLELHNQVPILPADLIMGTPLGVQKNLFPKLAEIVGVLSILAFTVWRFKGNVFY